MKLFSMLCLAVASAQELGLVIRCTNPELDEKPIRLYRGQLSVDDGPIFQAYFDTNKHFLISDLLIAKDHAGAGVGLTESKQLIVSSTPTTEFYARGGWLEHGSSAIFYAERDDDGWKLYTTPGDTSMRATPAMLQLADIVYENGDAPEEERLITGLQVIPSLSNSTVQPTGIDSEADKYDWEELNRLISNVRDDNFIPLNFDDEDQAYDDDYDFDDDFEEPYVEEPRETVPRAGDGLAGQKPFYQQSKNSTLIASHPGHGIKSATEPVLLSTHAAQTHSTKSSSVHPHTGTTHAWSLASTRAYPTRTQAIESFYARTTGHSAANGIANSLTKRPHERASHKTSRIISDGVEPTATARRSALIRPQVITRYATAVEYYTVFAPVPTVTKIVQVLI